MNILILGCAGQVGAELVRARWGAQVHTVGLARRQLDITVASEIATVLRILKPHIVVNAAAYTAVDGAQTDEAGAFAANADGPMKLAQECHRRGVPLIHLSTDYVFDGSATRPYRETDPICPINVYGRSKAEGEAAVRHSLPQHVILRTSWVYASHGSNFVRTMLRLARERDEVRVVADQLGTPTSAADIASAIVQVARRITAPSGQPEADAPWGTYHYTGRGETSWHGLAAHILDHLERAGERRPSLTAIASADYPSRTPRPAYSVLDCSLIEQVFGIVRPSWETSVDRVLGQLMPCHSHERVLNGGVR
jgi:dTDP-4-dehydrorhamnose reductase